MNHNENFDQKHALRLAGAMAEAENNLLECRDIAYISINAGRLDKTLIAYNNYIYTYTSNYSYLPQK